MYFHLKEAGFISDTAGVVLNDFSASLINSARVVQSVEPSKIYNELESLRIDYIKSLGGKEIPRNQTKEIREERFYYKRRSEFNQLSNKLGEGKSITSGEKLRLCALMIFLNRTGFNGMFRVNKKGEMNVPEGDYPNLKSIRSQEHMAKCSELLKCVELICKDWRRLVSMPKEGDLVYIDPPYADLKKNKKTFTTYSTGEFQEDDQIELADSVCKLVKEKKCKAIASNHNTTWVKEVYKNAALKHDVEIIFRHILVRRAVGRSKESRKKVKEFLIFIYPKTK